MSSTVLSAQWWEFLQTAGDRAISEEARRSRVVRRFFEHTTPSVSVDQAYKECLESLMEVSKEASRPNWDGYDASPVSDATLAQAMTFLNLLPSSLPKPQMSPHPDGELAFEWSFGPRRLLTVAINGSGRMSYAALFGQSRVYGTEYLLDAFPEPLAMALRKLHALA